MSRRAEGDGPKAITDLCQTKRFGPLVEVMVIFAKKADFRRLGSVTLDPWP